MIGKTNSGGGGIRLKVIGGTTMPPNPLKNVLWINTETPIIGYVASAKIPKTADDGIVWIQTIGTGLEINIGTKNTILLNLSTAKLRANGMWNNVEGFACVNKEFVKFSSLQTVFYKDGMFYDDYRNNILNGAISYNSDSVVLKTNANAVCESYVEIGPIQLDGVKNINIRVKNGSTLNVVAAIFVSQETGAKRNDAVAISENTIAGNDKNEYTFDLDVAGLSGNGFYVNAGINTRGSKWTNARTAYIYEITAK